MSFTLTARFFPFYRGHNIAVCGVATHLLNVSSREVDTNLQAQTRRPEAAEADCMISIFCPECSVPLKRILFSHDADWCRFAATDIGLFTAFTAVRSFAL